MRKLLAFIVDWIRAPQRPAEPVQLDQLNWRRRESGERLNVTWATVCRQSDPGCVNLHLKLYGGGYVSIILPLRSADRLAREILRAPIQQYEHGPTCKRPPRWLTSSFPLRSGRLLPKEFRQ